MKKAHSIAFRVTKAEALDLPDTIDEIRPVTLNDKAQKLYKAFVKESYMELSKGEQGAPMAVTATNILMAKYLTEHNIPTPRDKNIWRSTTVESILKNEKYKGAALLQKTFTTDFLTKKKKINEDEIP